MNEFDELIDSYRAKLIDICYTSDIAMKELDQFKLYTNPPDKSIFSTNDYIYLVLIDYKEIVYMDSEEYELIKTLIRSEDYDNYIIVAELLKKYKIKEKYLK